MGAYINFCVIYFVLLFYIEKSHSLKILKLAVPPVIDLQENAVSLDCKYDMETQELYAVKWYKDEQEFFRYVPNGNGEQSFPVSGIFMRKKDDQSTFCDLKHCPVILTNLTRAAEGVYMCEVLTEAPAFRLAFKKRNMTIIALPRGEVNISTPKTEYVEGEEIFVNCTSPAADPPPKIRWYINDKLMNSSLFILESDSRPDKRGLIIRSLAAQLQATKKLFLQNNNLLALRCEVSVPNQIPLHSTVYMSMYQFKTQRFDLLSSQGTEIHFDKYLLLSVFIAYVAIF